MNWIVSVASAAGVMLVSSGGSALAAQGAPAPSAPLQQRESRYQISQMERMLEGAVEHGATILRDRLQAVLPAQLLISDNARVRGFRLDGYGIFFDVEVPSLVPSLLGSLPWSFRTLDQNDLGLDSALRDLKTHVNAAGDPRLQQALQRLELQVRPDTPTSALALPAGARNATGAAAAVAPSDPPSTDPIMDDPAEAYRIEVKQQLMDAMLDYSVPLAIGAEEWLIVGVRRHDDRPLVAPADSDASTFIIRIRGGDLTAFRSGQLSRADALKRIEVKVF